MARRRRSINLQIIGVKMSIASGILAPGQTIVFALDMKLSSRIESKQGKSTPRGSRNRIINILSSALGMWRAEKGFDVSTTGTR